MDTETVGGLVIIAAIAVIVLFIRHVVHAQNAPETPDNLSSSTTRRTPTEEQKQYQAEQNEKLMTKVDFVQTAVNVIRSDRRKVGLPDNAAYQIAYFSLMLYLLADVHFLTRLEKDRIAMIYSLHVLKETGQPAHDTMRRFEGQFHRLKRESPDDFLKNCIVVIELLLCDSSRKNDNAYLLLCRNTVLDSIRFILESIETA